MAQVTDGLTVERTEKRMDGKLEGRELSTDTIASSVQLSTTILTLCSTIIHDEPYALQYNYPRRALRSSVQ
jgi:hypothetical protein